ncbi:MAG: polysaccharide deacetylase family protein [Cyanobacteria bacterium J06632_22]
MSLFQNSSFTHLDTLPHHSLKRRALKGIQPMLYWSGLAPAYARLRETPTATILMYHSVPAPAQYGWVDPCNSMPAHVFEQQMAFLAERRHVVSLDQLIAALNSGESLPRGTVAITFDDGYLDNLEVAAPILEHYQLPAVVYLATDYIDRGSNQWIDTLYGYFRVRSQQQLDLLDVGLRRWTLINPFTLREAYFSIVDRLITAPVSLRKAILSEVRSQLAPLETPPRLTMTWDDVRRLRREYPNFMLGVHTVNHIDLTSHVEATNWEVQTAIARVEAETGYRPHHFAYPYNRCNNETRAQLQQTSIRSAVTTADEPVVRPHPDIYALPRLEASRSMTLLRLRTSGAFPDLSKRLLGRAWTDAH